MTSLYKMILGSADMEKPMSCLITNLSSVSQAIRVIQERLINTGDAFTIMNGDLIADDILLIFDRASNAVRVSISGVEASIIDLSTGTSSARDAFDPMKAQSALVVVIFNRKTPYPTVIAEFVAIASSLRGDNRNIHCVFLQNKLEQKSCSST